MNHKLLYIVLITSFLLFSGMSCGDEDKQLTRMDEALKSERKRAERAEAERKKEAIINRSEKELLNSKINAEKIRRQWSDNYALIICLGFCISLLNLGRIYYLGKRGEGKCEIS